MLIALQAFPFAAWDDISAAKLGPLKVAAARKLEIEYAEKKLVWKKISSGDREEAGMESN